MIALQKCYHPLALEALGWYCAQFDPQNPTEWAEKLNDLTPTDTFYKDPVFKILKTGFSALESSSQRLLFFNVAIFAPRNKLESIKDLCHWLEGVHNLSQAEVMWEAQALIQVAKEVSNSAGHVFVHDLYKELAEHEIKLDAASRWCVYERGKTLPWCLRSNPQGSHWENLVRVKLQTPHPIALKKENLQQWANLQALCLHADKLEHLDVQPLKQLRSLEVFSKHLKSLTGTKNKEQLRCVELNCPSLKIHELKFNSCGTLEVFHLREVHPPSRPSHFKITPLWFSIPSIPRKMLDLQQSHFIRNLKIVGNQSINQALEEQWRFGIAGLAALTNLNELRLICLPVRSLPGLEKLNSLEVLDLLRCDQHKVVLPNLSQCTSLQALDVSWSRISEILGLDKMKNLWRLDCDGCKGLRNLPDLCSLENLLLIVTNLDPRAILALEGCLQTTWAKLEQYFMSLVKESRPTTNHDSIYFQHLSREEVLEALPTWQFDWHWQNFWLESTWIKYHLYAE